MTTDLVSLGWDERLAAAFARFPGADFRPGRVSQVDRGVCTVLTAAGVVRASVAGALLVQGVTDPNGLPCAGDWLVVRSWPDGRTTAEAVLPRRSAVVWRDADPDATGRVLAANLDVVAVVEPMVPGPDPARIERLLALAAGSGARPLVLLTKADAVAHPRLVAAQVSEAMPGVAVLAVSAQRGDGMDRLRAFVGDGRTLGLIGPSGAGRSTLVNVLVGPAATGVPQRLDGAGGQALLPVSGGGAVLDLPGIAAEQDFGGPAVRRVAGWQPLQSQEAREMRRRDARTAAAGRSRSRRLARGVRRPTHP